jgi:hypothetical protein
MLHNNIASKLRVQKGLRLLTDRVQNLFQLGFFPPKNGGKNNVHEIFFLNHFDQIGF